MTSMSLVLAKLHEITTAFSCPVVGQSLRDTFQGISAGPLDLFDADHSTITLLDES
jgi:hypothetical protein